MVFVVQFCWGQSRWVIGGRVAKGGVMKNFVLILLVLARSLAHSVSIIIYVNYICNVMFVLFVDASLPIFIHTISVESDGKRFGVA